MAQPGPPGPPGPTNVNAPGPASAFPPGPSVMVRRRALRLGTWTQLNRLVAGSWTIRRRLAGPPGRTISPLMTCWGPPSLTNAGGLPGGKPPGPKYAQAGVIAGP